MAKLKTMHEKRRDKLKLYRWALEEIHALLDGNTFDVGMVEDVAQFLEVAGFPVRAPAEIAALRKKKKLGDRRTPC